NDDYNQVLMVGSKSEGGIESRSPRAVFAQNRSSVQQAGKSVQVQVRPDMQRAVHLRKGFSQIEHGIRREIDGSSKLLARDGDGALVKIDYERGPVPLLARPVNDARYDL